MRSMARWGMHLPQRFSRRGSTSSKRRRIDVWRSRILHPRSPRSSTFGTSSRPPFFASSAGSDLLGWGIGYSVTREDFSTYGHHFPHLQSSPTFPGLHLSPPGLSRMPEPFIPHSPLPPHLPLCPLPTHLPSQACSHCTSGEEITSITVHILPTGVYASWASTNFPGYQTGSLHPRPAAQTLMTIITAMIYRQNSERFTARTAFLRLNKSLSACARCEHRSCGRWSSRVY